MTEFESMQLLDSAVANLIAQGDSINSLVAVFYTLLFGYILAAYVAGAALTAIQVILATCIYSLMMLIGLFSLQGDLEIFASIYRAVAERSPEVDFDEAEVAVFKSVVLALNASLFLASLYFMWTVRHPKTE